MDANAACSEIPSEYSVFMCKAETLHYLHVCLLHAAAVFQALKCAQRAAAFGPSAGVGAAGAAPAARAWGEQGLRGEDGSHASPAALRERAPRRPAALPSRPGARGRVPPARLPPARRPRVAPLPARGSAPRFPGLSRALRARHSNVLRGAGRGASRHWPRRHSPMGVRAAHWPGAAVRQRAAECVRLG